VWVTVLEAIQKSTEFLSRKNVGSPRLQTELLLAHVLGLPRMKLYLNFDRPLSAAETDALRVLVVRRGQREPLQHIVGSASFCGLELRVSGQALVPRPETELLAELGWQFLQQRERERPAAGGPTALDFGTGSGCLAIALAVKCPSARITALDISAPALALAQENANTHQVAGRIEFLAGDGLTALNGAGENPATGPRCFDLIIANPPYIATAEIETLEPEVKDFDPRAALDGGLDGLDFYRLLARAARQHLPPQGKIMLEFGDDQADAISGIFAGENWIVEAIREDYSQRARIFVARPTGP
jgi:release factor glutamine methyltransferase